MVQFPMKKSKSLPDDSGEAVMMRSPFGANLRGGRGKLSIWADADVSIDKNRRVARKTERAIMVNLWVKAISLLE